jgi:hypothetical protein
MFRNPNADPQSGYEKKKLRVVVDADTLFDAAPKTISRLGETCRWSE